MSTVAAAAATEAGTLVALWVLPLGTPPTLRDPQTPLDQAGSLQLRDCLDTRSQGYIMVPSVCSAPAVLYFIRGLRRYTAPECASRYSTTRATINR